MRTNSCIKYGFIFEFDDRLLAGIGDLLGIGDPGQAIARFDSMSDADVAEALSWLTADSAYKQAVAALGTSDGQRTV